MRKRSLGATGFEVSELALGTWGLGGDGYAKVEEAEQDAVIERARALGITLFDTADSYGRGAMELRLGRLLERDAEAIIVTKLGTDRDASPRRKRFDATYLRAAFERSRERLRRETVDVVLLHNPSPRALETDAATSVLAELKEARAIRAWGVSAGSEAVARVAIDRGADVIELCHNVFAASELQKLSEVVREKRIGILARSVLAHGLLCGLWGADKQFPSTDHRSERWTPDELRQRIRQLSALRPAVGNAVPTLRGAALRFVLSDELVATAVLGPRSALQLDQLVREAGREPPYLTPEALTALRARLRDAGVEQ
jgi:aryl-alcohol dehydrogenase-like predicted oxidoreductase